MGISGAERDAYHGRARKKDCNGRAVLFAGRKPRVRCMPMLGEAHAHTVTLSTQLFAYDHLRRESVFALIHSCDNGGSITGGS